MKNPKQSSLFIEVEKTLKANRRAIIVEVIEAVGSTPRDNGAKMLVTEDQLFGSIGGGQLEWIASENARELLHKADKALSLEIALGPQIGQCCGGKVTLRFEKPDHTHLSALALQHRDDYMGHVQIHGAGHTGKALLKALQLLPFNVQMIDTRVDAMGELDKEFNVSVNPLPESAVTAADPNTAFVIFTHDHSLDFLIAAEALKRSDAAYVGMIGSKTKRAVFKTWLSDNGYDEELIQKLTCPIGGASVKDKRPEVIAALVAAELLGVFSKAQIRE